jgi:Asp-tRNA(Asn)/Glu-tRNA(Gln) amidotransferase A subunit family amidase
MIRLSPTARADAARLDAERRAGRVRGPLHGIPIILKDNYGTAGWTTSAGSLALAGLVPDRDAFQVRKLREAGAVIVGKSNMHELASGITNISSLGGQTCNPYDVTRNPGGSSGGSGTAVAASFAVLAWGSDTCGSIRIPASANNLFGLRPSKGLSSIAGIIPLSHTQDVGGPLARTVTDLAIGLDATIGPDPADTATRLVEGRPPPRFASALDSTALRGARIGALAPLFGTDPDDQEAARVVRAALDRMKARGAEIVDVIIPGLDTLIQRAGVIDFELKPDLLEYLSATPLPPVHSLAEILESGLYHSALEAALRRREAQGTRDSEAYRAALRRRTVARDLVTAFLDANRLDALAYPTMRRKPARLGETQPGTNCQLSAVTGLPALAMPAGFTPDGLPIGVELLGRVLADARLVSLAYDYEQSARPRRAPDATPALIGGKAPALPEFTAAATSGGATLRGRFRHDPARRQMTYAVRLTGVPAADVVALTLERSASDRSAAVLHRLSGHRSLQASGVITFQESDQADLVAGRLVLRAYRAGRRAAALSATLTLARAAR